MNIFTPPPSAAASAPPSLLRGALNKRNVYLTIFTLIIATLWNTHSVAAAPAQIDSLDSTFPLDLQPPIFEATASETSSSQSNGDNNSKNDGTTIDSYGNPIESLQPIETPDGRKVVSAQGLQFEIPNYASGITELKKPSDDLLPPFVGEFSNVNDRTTTTTTTRTAYSIDDVGLDIVDRPGIIRITISKAVNDDDDDKSLQQQENRLRFKRQLQYNTTTDTNINNIKNYYNSLNTNTKQPQQDEVFQAQPDSNNKNDANTMTTTPTNINTNLKQMDPELSTTTINTPTPPPSSKVANSLSLNLVELNSSTIDSSFSSSSSVSPLPYKTSFQSPSSRTKLSAHYTPISNGNFNYPNVPTDTSIIDRIVSKYKNPLPTLDPIVVALPNESTNPGSSSTSAAHAKTSVHVESVPLVEVKTSPATTTTTTFNTKGTFFKVLPDYILEFNDPDIGGPVPYEPAEDNRGLKVIAWDLLPPLETDLNDKSISHSNKVSISTTGHNLASSHSTTHTSPQIGSRFSAAETTTKPSYTNNKGSYYSTSSTTSTTPRTTTTRRTTTTTTTTPRTTTTPQTTTTPRTTTTTTRRTTTPRTTTPRTTTVEPDSSEFFKLAAGDSYTLPPWLADIDDPELDVAVAFEVPEDINEYNHTLSKDILPPLEPYTDLHNIHLTPPPHHKNSHTTTPRTTTTRRTTTTTTTTTRKPTLSTNQPHWIRAKATSAKPTIATFNNQFTSLSPSITSTNFAQRTTSTTTTTTTTTTAKPKTTINYYNRQLSSTTPSTADKIGSGSSSEEQIKIQKNPFLAAAFDDGKYKPHASSRRTTTTTTTTTPAPEKVEPNPFEPTIPPWLKDFDYPDLAPGVPFVYDPNEDESPVDKNILPPSKTEETNKPSFITNPSSSSPFLNSQTPQGFTNKFTSSATSLASSSSIPSIVTIPLPSTQTNQDDSTFSRPPLVFVPPPTASAEGNVDVAKKTSSTFNKNFAAPFESSPATTTTATVTSSKKSPPLSADRESFPPFNNAITGSSTLPSKTTFTKSEDGKVITNNIFLSGSIGSTSAKPFGTSQTEKNTFTTQSFSGSSFTKATTASSVFKQFGTTSSAASGFTTSGGSTFGSTAGGDASKYTGRFGGPPGVLAPQNNGFSASSSTTVTKSYNQPSFTTFGVTASPGFAATKKDKFTGSFGGPPGVLKPYDNVKNR